MTCLFLTRRFYPQADAATKCVFNLIHEGNALGVEADVLYLAYQKAPVSAEYTAYCRPLPFYFPGAVDRESFSALLRFAPASAAISLFQKVIGRVSKALVPSFRAAGLDAGLYLAFYHAVKKQLKKKNYDAIIATLCPAEAAYAASQLHGQTPLFIYQLDPYTENLDMPATFAVGRRRIEEKIYRQAARVFTTPLILAQKQSGLFPCHHKCIALEFPLVRPAVCPPSAQTQPLLCVFAGTFYPAIRPADDLVRLISLLGGEQATFVFAGSGQRSIPKIPEYPAAKPRLQCLGCLPAAQAEALLQRADFLINIDNTAPNQVPSKIFEYINYGKPIINLYYNKNSPSLGYLSRYPLVLNLLCTPCASRENALALSQFLSQAAGCRVPPQQIHQAFQACTPGYVAQIFYHSIKQALPASAP